MSIHRYPILLTFLACHPGSSPHVALDADPLVDVAETPDGSSTIPQSCGNGVVDPGEQCDTGVRGLSGDGCSSACTLEHDLWTQLAATTMPPRIEFLSAWDVGRGRLVLFGGYDNNQIYADTWEFDGTTWTAAHPAVSPPAASQAAMVYDSTRQRVVAAIGNGTTMDTWEYEGTTWTKVATAHAPVTRSWPSMAYDAARHQVVLFGGFNSPSKRLSDTWVYDGSDWTQKTTSVYPPRRYLTEMTYDTARERVVLFGGNGNDGTLGDTWEWDGSAWTMRNVAAPPEREQAALVYDPLRARVVLYGGSNPSSTTVADVWELDGTSWTLRATTNGPPPRVWPGLAYDTLHDRLVVFGGSSTTSSYAADSWALSLSAVNAPRDACNAASDSDGDGLIACGNATNVGADPDCWGRCLPFCPPTTPNWPAGCDLAAPRCGDGVCGDNEDHLACPTDCP